MNPIDGNEYDNDHLVPAETLTDDEYTDGYDDKRGRSAVGRLFDDEDEVVAPVNRVPARTAVPVAPGSDDFLSQLNDNRSRRGERPRPVATPAATPSRKIERPGVRNPEPKPAMRARVAVTREPVPSRHVDDDHDAVNIGDDVDSFKNRYGNRDALGTARDPGSIDRNTSEDRITHPAGVKPRKRNANQAEHNHYQSSNPIRWLALAGVLVVLIVMIVLVVQNASMGSEIADLQAQLAATSGTASDPGTATDPGDETIGTAEPGGDPTALQLELETAREQLAQVNEELQVLINWLTDNEYNVAHIFDPPAEVPEPPPTTPDPTQPPPPPPHQYHTVTIGQTLSEISRLFYNSSAHYRVIAEANNIPPPFTGIRPGDVLVIPRLP